MMKQIIASMAAAVAFTSLQVAAQGRVHWTDADGDGKVTREEWLESFAKLAKRSGKEFSEEAVLARFEVMDKNKDGVITADDNAK